MTIDYDELDTSGFWTAVNERRLDYGVCLDCDRIIFFPRARCPHCASDRQETRTSRGLGTVYSLTVIRQTADPILQAAVPYAVALVDVDEGFRLTCHLRQGDRRLAIGDRVELSWDQIGDQTVPVFQLPTEAAVEPSRGVHDDTNR